MKRVVVSTVMGAFLLTAPVAFAFDKAASDTAAKEPAKTEIAPRAKQPEAVKPAPQIPVKTETAAPAAKTVSPLESKAPSETKAVKDSKKVHKAVKRKAAPEASKSAAEPSIASKAAGGKNAAN